MSSRLRQIALILFLFACLIVRPACAQQAAKRWVETEGTKRVALVIGNANYQNGPKLKNPVNDADAMAKALKALGFEVIVLKDATNRQMIEAINEFGEKLTGDCIALCYYSGHGIQSDGVNYLLPVDFNAKKRTDIQFEGVPAARLLAQFEEKQSPVNIVILDACRNNPFRSFTRSNEGGLTKMDAPRGTLIAYATSPGSVADDNSEGDNGLYTTALLNELPKGGIEVERMFKQVLEDVAMASGEKQTPWVESSLRGTLFLARNPASSPSPAPPPITELSREKIGKDALTLLPQLGGNRCITRGEFAYLIYQSFGDVLEMRGKGDRQAQFGDVAFDNPYFEAIAAVSNSRFLAGYPDGLFHDKRAVTRYEAAVILDKVLEQLRGKLQRELNLPARRTFTEESTTTPITQTFAVYPSEIIEVPSGFWAIPALRDLKAHGLLPLYGDEHFNGRRTLTFMEGRTWLRMIQDSCVGRGEQ